MSTATEMLDAYTAAEKAVLLGQSVRMADGRMLTRADLVEIRKGRAEWQRAVQQELAAAAAATGPRWKQAVFN